MIDLQWPHAISARLAIFENKYIDYNDVDLLTIEKFFTQRYNCKYAFLMPSSRASIALILRYLKFNRSNNVEISKWSSHCMFTTIGAISNVSINSTNPDMTIVNHKWGNFYKYTGKSKYVIEDSVDSLPGNNFKPFLNLGIAEIISLPKIIGAYSGGIVLTNNESLYSFGKLSQLSGEELGVVQSKKKYDQAISKLSKYDTWYYHEAWNTYIEGNAIKDIEKCLDFFDLNTSIISKRRKILYSEFGFEFELNRLGPCAVLSKDLFYKVDKLNLDVKNFNFSRKMTERDEYKSCLMLPIHFQVSEEVFNTFLLNINKNIKK
jgi:putative PLP-dependent aminotransferase (TIGR04422 family)